jgi:hypothetical protein
MGLSHRCGGWLSYMNFAGVAALNGDERSWFHASRDLPPRTLPGSESIIGSSPLPLCNAYHAPIYLSLDWDWDRDRNSPGETLHTALKTRQGQGQGQDMDAPTPSAPSDDAGRTPSAELALQGHPKGRR